MKSRVNVVTVQTFPITVTWRSRKPGKGTTSLRWNGSLIQDCRRLLHNRQTSTTFVLLLSSRHIITLISRVYPGVMVIYVMLDPLSTQSSSTNIAARRFSCCAPTVWNSLASFVRTADRCTIFRSQLKTYLLARHFSPLVPTKRVINSLLTYSLTYV